MTVPGRAERDGAWRYLIAFALLLFCWSHRDALQLTGFADDLGLLAELTERATRGTLLADVQAKWFGALWPGSTMWRPVPYATFALDAELWGNAPGRWRLINLLLHVGVCVFTGLIARRLVGNALAGAAAAAVVLLTPWATEVTLWLVGRFDGWATLAIAVSLWAALRAQGVDRWLAVSLGAAAVAYASKESALILPVWIVLVLATQIATAQSPWQKRPLDIARAIIQQHGVHIAAHAAVAAGYLAWRSALFVGQAISVYASTPEYRALPLAARTLAHLSFPIALAPLAPIAAVVAAVSGILCVLLAARWDGRIVALLGAAMALCVVTAVAIHFAKPPGAGEGYRLYYLATLGHALIIAAAFSTRNRLATPLIVILITALALWQSSVAAEWTRASRTIDGAAKAMTSAATILPSTEFGLVLMPDLMGHVPVARNAQGALLALRDGTSPAREAFIIFTPPQLAEWHQLAQQDIVRKLTDRVTAPPGITRYFCFNSSRLSLEDLGYWPPGAPREWDARWRAAVASRCPELTL